jgi:hypothetical protein
MKNRIIIICICLITILGGISLYTLKENSNYKAEIEIQKENVKTLNTSVYKFKTDSGLDAAKIRSLAYSKKELETYREEDIQTIQDLKIKLKNVTSAMRVKTETITKIETRIIYNDTLKCIDYKSEFIDVKGCFGDSIMNLEIHTREKLSAIITTQFKHKFLWFEWGTQTFDLTVTSKNKRTIITDLDYVVIKQ